MNKYEVFLVDDDEDDRSIFEEALQSLGMKVGFRSACNGHDALGQLQGSAYLPSILFVDLNMPVMNGLELLQTIKNDPSLSDIPVFMYSTSSSPSDMNRAAELGATGYIIKHTSFRLLSGELKETLQNHIGARQ
jgi:CheY-like chemotaxis protein